MGRKFRINGKRVVDVDELARSKYLDAKRIDGSRYVVTDEMISAPFPRGSADLRAAAEKALIAELEASIKEPKK
jgi:hypothetical protein